MSDKKSSIEPIEPSDNICQPEQGISFKGGLLGAGENAGIPMQQRAFMAAAYNSSAAMKVQLGKGARRAIQMEEGKSDYQRRFSEEQVREFIDGYSGIIKKLLGEDRNSWVEDCRCIRSALQSLEMMFETGLHERDNPFVHSRIDMLMSREIDYKNFLAEITTHAMWSHSANKVLHGALDSEPVGYAVNSEEGLKEAYRAIGVGEGEWELPKEVNGRLAFNQEQYDKLLKEDAERKHANEMREYALKRYEMEPFQFDQEVLKRFAEATPEERVEMVMGSFEDDKSQRDFSREFQSLMASMHFYSAANGFWEDETQTSDGNKIALMHGELSEMMEGCRKPSPSDKLGHLGFTQVEEEAADVMIRLMEWCYRNKVRLPEAMFAKMEYNANRPYKHGSKF